MIPLASLRQALADADLGFASVGMAAEFGAARRQTIVYPTAWLLPGAHDPGPNRFAYKNIVDQRVGQMFFVMLAVRDISRVKGSTQTELESLLEAVVATMVRFAPPQACGPIVPGRGQIVTAPDAEGNLIWQQAFTVSFNRRLTAT